MAISEEPTAAPTHLILPGEPDVGDAHATEEPQVVVASTESIDEPGKVIRIGSMIKQLLEEVRASNLDEPSRQRLAEVYETSVRELGAAVSQELREELDTFVKPFRTGEVPSESELRVAQAQLVGWLEGLFHGIQATLMAQQLAAQNQLAQMRQRSLPAAAADTRPGTYL